MKKKLTFILLLTSLLFLFISCNKASIDSENQKVTIEKPIINNESSSTKGNNNVEKSSKAEKKPTTPTPEIKNRDVRLYYYDVNLDKLVYLDTVIEIKDKAVATAIVNALKSPSNNKITPAISSKINIKSASVDLDNDLIRIDFTDNFVKEQNLGSGPEAMTLQAIVNTLGYNFNVNKVKITLGGKPYNSGHFSYNENEYIPVNYNDCVEFK
ncbi:GerMN domain-containing protein [Clostridium chauvoei]|uniref:GerMN domain-containing protein n=2 Tax=Clostridium chauvoei TaxID=46867 RepID=A0A1U6JBR5_9CLOT|nr:GerMN domain-containing protein [Clostridium chauvoei]ATD54995.1 hypothetical protein BTM20_06980 [Clostridium chauvoei]ATD57328.1 hypothetical protein BTM21_06080 [Clostridium chauvoei]MBX7281800.1 GerMN domain-containing protein [Clostridium chauvoei]MBX7284330.1 GerMN domain-containing protein [Clostridium chauvoei]MBX7286829.1 GerMN domain-containing protein [Clostridium chauvoei]